MRVELFRHEQDMLGDDRELVELYSNLPIRIDVCILLTKAD